MKRIGRAMSMVLALVMVLGMVRYRVVNAEMAEKSEAKVYSNATLDEEFADDRVLVVLKNDVSLKFEDLQASEFSDVDCAKVVDISAGIGDLVKEKQALAERALASETPSRVLAGQKVSDVDISQYQRVLCLELNEKGKEKVLSAIATLEKKDDIVYVGPDYVMSIGSTTRNDPYYELQWNLRMIDLPLAWDYVVDPYYVNVGVLDTGIDGTHPDLMTRINVGMSRDFTSGEEERLTSVTDPHGHGTHVAGIIGAKSNNSVGVSGVCEHARFVSLRVFEEDGQGVTSHIISAIDYAARTEIKVLNFSGGWADIINYPLQTSINSYTGLFVCAAMNDGYDIDVQNVNPASFNLPNMICVGSSGSADTKYSTSNYGNETVHIFAPGAGIYSTWTGGTYSYDTGTSMAAPHVTGVVALMLSIDPEMTTSELKSAIMNGAEEVYRSGNNVFEDLCISRGRLNAYMALQAAGLCD